MALRISFVDRRIEEGEDVKSGQIVRYLLVISKHLILPQDMA
jgi:hypothetical protein